jgi:hypothetical protein
MASQYDQSNLAGVALSIHASHTISDTTPYVPPAGFHVAAIKIVSPAIFDTLTGTLTGYASVTYPGGYTITGVFTAVTLTSGAVEVVLARNT